MFKSLLLCASFSLFLFFSVHTVDSINYDPFPNCTAAQKSNETTTKLAACLLPNFKSNFSDPTACCKFWEAMNCRRDVYFTIPECKPARYLFEVRSNAQKPVTCIPDATCANVTMNAAIGTVTENVFAPLEQLTKSQTYHNCSSTSEKGIIACAQPFQAFIDAQPTEKNLCCDQWAFQECAQKVTTSEASCAVAKGELDSIFKTMGENIAKKCPATKFSCKNGAGNASLTLWLFTVSLMIALFARIS